MKVSKIAVLIDAGFYRRRAQALWGEKTPEERRKVALRLCVLADAQACYTLRPDAVKKLCSGSLLSENLEEKHFMLDVTQKGVDMKIGVDIASLAYKGQVEKIVLISGDSDFVPAAKLARREGIDFVLDPMWIDV